MVPRAQKSKASGLIASIPRDCLIEKCLTKNVSRYGIHLTETLRVECPLDAKHGEVMRTMPLGTATGRLEGFEMSACIHCQIHDLLESHLQNQEVNLGDIAFKVTEVLADLILMAPPEDQGMMIADVLRNLGQFVLEKNGAADDEKQSGRRRH